MEVRVTGTGRRDDGRFTLRVSSSDVDTATLRERVVAGLRDWPSVDNVDWDGQLIEFAWAAPLLSEAQVWTEVTVWLEKLSARWPEDRYEPA